jgi:hypothetical protein
MATYPGEHIFRILKIYPSIRHDKLIGFTLGRLPISRTILDFFAKPQEHLRPAMAGSYTMVFAIEKRIGGLCPYTEGQGGVKL